MKGNRAVTVKDEILKKWGGQSHKFKLVPSIPDKLMRGRTKAAIAFCKKLAMYRNVLAATEAIDFECGFDKNGICVDKQGQEVHENPKLPMCCCMHCASSCGYFGEKPMVSDKEMVLYERLYDDVLGFWVEGKGCSLPRDKRSITCVFYNCLYKLSGGRKEKEKAIWGLKQTADLLLQELLDMIKEAK